VRKRMVVRYADGRVAKGFSNDFYPTKDGFQLIDRFTDESSFVRLADLKAVFFVKSFDTDGLIRMRDDIERVGLGRKLRVRFLDGEEILGFSTTYSPDRKAFVLFPGDPDSNHEKVVIVTSATESVEWV
jgi:hypothetical protein